MIKLAVARDMRTFYSLGAALAAGILPFGLTISKLEVQVPILAALYLLFLLNSLGVFLVATLAALRAWNGSLAALAAPAIAYPFAHHIRETSEAPSGRVAMLAFLGIVAVVLLGIASGLAKSMRLRPLVLTALLSGALGVLLSVSAFYGSPYLRWLLSHKVNSVGAPLNLALGTPVLDIYRSLRKSSPSVQQTAAPDHAEAGAEAPDVYFILLDTLRADALAIWGSRTSHVPFLDRTAATGTAFSNVYANASWTRPSVGSFFTGLLPEEHGARDRDEALDPRMVTLAERFQRLGYRTLAVVANHAAVGADAGFDRGFDVFVEPEEMPYARAGRVRTLAEATVRLQSPDQPIFAYFHFLDPHTPYLSSQVSEPEKEENWRDYLDELAYLDSELRTLVDSINRARGSNAWFFFTSDHGEEFRDHGRLGHGHTLYSELLQIPAILYHPQRQAMRIDHPLEARDFFRLLPQLADSRMQLEEWSEQSARSVRYSSLYLTQLSMARIRRRIVVARRIDTASSTLIWNAYGDTYEVYDTKSDPRQLRNLLYVETKRAHRLRELLHLRQPGWAPHTPAAGSDHTIGQLRALGYL